MSRAIAEYISKKKPEVLTLVAMGERAKRKAPEDEACADYIEHLLTGKPIEPIKVFRNIVYQPTAQKFLLGSKPYLPREDPIFCLQRNLFDFVLTVKRVQEQLEVFKIVDAAEK
jgi:2-phosphosulfolactate phosphatase